MIPGRIMARAMEQGSRMIQRIMMEILLIRGEWFVFEMNYARGICCVSSAQNGSNIRR